MTRYQAVLGSGDYDTSAASLARARSLVPTVVGGNKPGGSHFEKGFFVEPTLFDNVRPDLRVAQEEIFGPVLSVIVFTDVDEAINIANGTRSGLGASVWTRDIQRAIQLATSIESGQVYINQISCAHRAADGVFRLTAEWRNGWSRPPMSEAWGLRSHRWPSRSVNTQLVIRLKLVQHRSGTKRNGWSDS